MGTVSRRAGYLVHAGAMGQLSPDFQRVSTEAFPDRALSDYYAKLAEWLELRTRETEAREAYRVARAALESFNAGHFPELHRQRERLTKAGVKLTPLGRLTVEPQGADRLRRGAAYYRGLVKQGS